MPTSDDHNEFDHELELVVPFIVVESKGGPYDDQAFVAGYQVGEIDVRLAFANMAGAQTVKFPIVRRSLLAQLELHGMRYGFTSMEASEATSHIPASDEWCSLTFARGPQPESDEGGT